MRDPEETYGIDWRGPWVIVDLDDGWEAVYSLAPQGSDIVIAGVEIRSRMPPGVLPPGGLTTRLTRTLRPPVALRLFRDELAEFLTPGTAAFRAQAAMLGFFATRTLKEQVTSGAITPEIAASAMTLLAADEPGWQDWLFRHGERWTGWGAALDELGPGSRRPPRDRLRRLAETASLYVSALADNDPAPNRRVAEIQGRTPEKVRDDLRAARRAEFLTATPGRGRAGGTLMAKAREILESE